MEFESTTNRSTSPASAGSFWTLPSSLASLSASKQELSAGQLPRRRPLVHRDGRHGEVVTQTRSVKARLNDKPAEDHYSLPVRAPYRLDLTVNVLRRLSTNLVDVLTPDGAYVRRLGDGPELAVVRVCQPDPDTLTVEIDGDRREHPELLALVRRMLGVEVDLTRFYRSASQVEWLHPLVCRMRGVRPPRYPTVWEACVNAI